MCLCALPSNKTAAKSSEDPGWSSHAFTEGHIFIAVFARGATPEQAKGNPGE